MLKKIVFIFYPILIVCLFLYSFTQVDLNLTFSRASWFQSVEKSFQYIGYFNRPLSTYIFIGLLLLFLGFYICLLVLAKQQQITIKQFWILLFITTFILLFSYNAFSYDVFNYIFDAKIITFYHQNPYLHRALDFPQDKMLNFMRWTHRYYPYGPFWLLLTVPLSYIGLQIFLPTFFLFKFLMAGCFLGTCYFLQKICQKLFPKNTLFSLIFFAFNPLILIECLVSAHNDIVMLFFAMIAIWLLMWKKWVGAFLMLLFSIGIKFATVFLLPVFVLFVLPKTAKSKLKILNQVQDDEFFFLLGVILMIVGVIFASVRTQFQPWYLLYALPFASLLAKKYYVSIPVIIMTFFALLEYVPYLYQGDWNPPIPSILLGLTTGGIIISIFGTIGWRFVRKR